MPDVAEKPIRVIVAAPYAAVRAGLRALLADAPDIDVIAEGSGSADLDEQIARLRPRVIVADPEESDSIRLLNLLMREDVSVVWLSESREMLARLAESGLAGWAWLPRQAEGAGIAGAVRASAAGLASLDRAAASALVSRAARADGARSTIALSAEDENVLTAREREVLQLMANGLANKVIAARLGVSLHTIKFHVASILAKLDAESRTEAVTIGARRGLVAL